MLCRITGPYPIEMVSFPVGIRLDVGLSRPSSSDHIKYLKYLNYMYTYGIQVQRVVARVNLLNLEAVNVLVYVVSKNHFGKVTQLG